MTELRRVGDKTHRIVWIAIISLTVGMAIVSFLLAQGVGQGKRVGLGVTAFLLYTVSLTIGAGLGFLFGLPRSRAIDGITLTDPDSRAAHKPSSHFLANSNLIKVSDWLTTIIIGLGLVNLTKLIPSLRRLAADLKAPLGGLPHSSTVGLSIVIGSAVIGFILGYIWTTIRVRELLEEAERDAQGRTRVPDLLGARLIKAEKALQANFLTPVRSGNFTDKQTVATQDPVAGTEVEKHSTVTITST